MHAKSILLLATSALAAKPTETLPEATNPFVQYLEALDDVLLLEWVHAEVRKLVRIGAIHCPESLDTKQRVSRLQQRFPELSHALANGALRLEAGNSVLAGKRLQQLQNARIRLCESPTAVAPSCVCM
jgi:hypothetical protein